MLIGLHGGIGAGKDTLAEYLQEKYEYNRYAFADALKQTCSKLFGVDEELFYSREGKEHYFHHWDMTPRKMAQIVGTEVIRNTFGADHWIKRLEFQLIHDEVEYGTSREKTVITDVRFQNEVDYIIKQGGYIIEVIRPNNPLAPIGEVAAHASEHQELYIPADINYLVMNEGTKEQFFSNVEFMYNLIKEKDKRLKDKLKEEFKDDIPF